MLVFYILSAININKMPQNVELYVYDLSNGMASQLSPLLLNIHIEAIYHTSIVIFNHEICFTFHFEKCKQQIAKKV